jgi:hypothetical protein
MSPEEWEAFKQKQTKAELSRKHPGTAPGQRAAADDSMDQAELGPNNRRGS